MEETPRDRFVRLATSRFNNALEAMRLIGNLASPNYEYTDQDVEKIFDELEGYLATIKSKFTNTKKLPTLQLPSTPKPTHKSAPKRQEETRTVLDQAVQALRVLEDWVTAEDLAEMIGSSSTYITRVLMEDIKENRKSRVIVKYFQIHGKGRSTPHYQYIPIPNS